MYAVWNGNVSLFKNKYYQTNKQTKKAPSSAFCFCDLLKVPYRCIEQFGPLLWPNNKLRRATSVCSWMHRSRFSDSEIFKSETCHALGDLQSDPGVRWPAGGSDRRSCCCQSGGRIPCDNSGCHTGTTFTPDMSTSAWLLHKITTLFLFPMLRFTCFFCLFFKLPWSVFECSEKHSTNKIYLIMYYPLLCLVYPSHFSLFISIVIMLN